MIFKEKIIKLREERKLTIETISSSLNISEYDLTSFEEGTLEPTLDQIRLLANFYDITIESLIDDNSDIVKNRKSIKKRLNVLKLIAKLLYFFAIGLTIMYFNSYLSTVLLQKPSMRLIYGIEGEFIFPVVGFIGVLALFLFIVLFSSKLATRLSKNTKGFGTEILVLLILPLILLLSELFANLQASILTKNIDPTTDSFMYTLYFSNMLVGCRAMLNGITPLFIFALMMSLSIKILDRSAYQPKIIQREHQVWHNFIALVFGFKVGLFSLPFYVAFKKEQSHICKGTKMGLFYTLGFIGSFWTTIISILVVALLAFLRSKLNF